MKIGSTIVSILVCVSTCPLCFSFQGTADDLSNHDASSSVVHLSLSQSKIVGLETEQHSLKDEITQLSSVNEDLKKTLEEQDAIFRANVDDLKRQLAGTPSSNRTEL